MKIFIGSDHAGFELKNKLVTYLQELGYEVEDKGAVKYDQQDDYPDFVKPVAQAVSEDKNAKGIIIGGSGQGEAICANRFNGIRAFEYYAPSREEISIVKDSRDHNDSNIISLGARFLSEDEAFEAVKLWLETPFSGDERHKRRIEKIDRK